MKRLLALLLPGFACGPVAAPDESGASQAEAPKTDDRSCKGGRPLIQRDLQAPTVEIVDAGIEICEGGLFHRHASAACVYPMKVWTCDCEGPCGEFGDGVCHDNFHASAGCGCAYPCTSDADCSPGSACLCAASTALDDGSLVQSNQCVPADCRADADCGDYLCAASRGVCGAVEGLYCKSAIDDCIDDADCLGRGEGSLCRYSTDVRRWVCDESGICE